MILVDIPFFSMLWAAPGFLLFLLSSLVFFRGKKKFNRFLVQILHHSYMVVVSSLFRFLSLVGAQIPAGVLFSIYFSFVRRELRMVKKVDARLVGHDDGILLRA